MTRAENQAEGGGGKGAQGKALEHFVNGDEQAAQPKADDHALRGRLPIRSGRNWLMA